MTNIIALTQFVFIALGTLAVNLLVKTEQSVIVVGRSGHSLATFLAAQGIWLMLIPVLFTFYALACQGVKRGFFSEKVARPVGIAMNVIIFAVYAYVVLWQF